MVVLLVVSTGAAAVVAANAGGSGSNFSIAMYVAHPKVKLRHRSQNIFDHKGTLAKLSGNIDVKDTVIMTDAAKAKAKAK